LKAFSGSSKGNINGRILIGATGPPNGPSRKGPPSKSSNGSPTQKYLSRFPSRHYSPT
jgi:hypothetical protein